MLYKLSPNSDEFETYRLKFKISIHPVCVNSIQY